MAIKLCIIVSLGMIIGEITQVSSGMIALFSSFSYSFYFVYSIILHTVLLFCMSHIHAESFTYAERKMQFYVQSCKQLHLYEYAQR